VKFFGLIVGGEANILISYLCTENLRILRAGYGDVPAEDELATGQIIV
jgi:hypothetical protein